MAKKRLNFGLKDVVDWSEMEVATTFLSSRRCPQELLKEVLRRLQGLF